MSKKHVRIILHTFFLLLLAGIIFVVSLKLRANHDGDTNMTKDQLLDRAINLQGYHPSKKAKQEKNTIILENDDDEESKKR